jgi:BlaI family transcriptional regulator, penicillinase repressor
VPRKKSPTLTAAELRLMDILWDRGASTVGEVAEVLPKDSKLAYSSVLTTLRILERKGHVRHQQRGRAYVYEPLVARDDARRSALRYVMSQFFEDSPELLVLNVLENEDLSEDELSRLRKMIEDAD